MMDAAAIEQFLPQCFQGKALNLTQTGSGKVREWYDLSEERRLIITTDRLSAFDRVLALVPYKGQVLNQLSAWWFEQTRSIIDNHLISLPDPNAALVRKVKPLPVEVIVRGFITGVTSTALWYRYNLGERDIYGYTFPDGLRKNQLLPELIITPTTKGVNGEHDERLTCREVAEKGLVEPSDWALIQEAALNLFQQGQEIAARAGMILVDTKYEFGLTSDERVVLIDELHTPDSSRFWKADSYEIRFKNGEEPENYDKEFIRRAYADLEYQGEGEAPQLPDDVWITASQRYIAIYEQLTGEIFKPGDYPVAQRMEKNLKKVNLL